MFARTEDRDWQGWTRKHEKLRLHGYQNRKYIITLLYYTAKGSFARWTVNKSYFWSTTINALTFSSAGKVGFLKHI